MTTYLGKSCSFCLPRVPFVNCRQFMYLVISLLVLRAGYGIWLYQFLIIAYLFTLFLRSDADMSSFQTFSDIVLLLFFFLETHVSADSLTTDIDFCSTFSTVWKLASSMFILAHVSATPSDTFCKYLCLSTLLQLILLESVFDTVGSD